jgi:hypothetical protein
MSEKPGTIELIGTHVTEALRPFREALRDDAAFRQFLRGLGWNPTGVPPAYASIGVSIDGAGLKLDGLGPAPDLAAAVALMKAAKDAFDSLQSIGVAPPGVNAAAFLAEVKGRLFERLLTDHLNADLPALFNALRLLNVIGFEPVASVPGRPSFVRATFKWPELPKIISEPGELPARAFGWGTPAFDVGLLIETLAELSAARGLPIRLARPARELLAGYLGVAVSAASPMTPSLFVPIFRIESGGVSLEAGLAIHALPPVGGALPGIVLELHVPTAFPRTLRLADWVTLRTLSASEPAAPFGIRLRPGSVSVVAPFAPATTPPPIGLGLDFTPRSPTVLLGDPTGSRLEFAGASLDLNASFTNGAWAVNVGADLKGVKFVFDPGEGDGFLRFLIGSAKTEIGLPLGLHWGGDGIRFGGSASFNVVVHPNVSIGPAEVEEIDVRLGVPLGGKPRVLLEVGAAISTELGPVSMMLKGVGLKADVLFEPGNAGPFDINVGFKPPTGVGVAIDGGGFKGGGFLSFDPERGEYGGTLELTFAEVISVRAVGILSTRLPDGRDSFSLLLIIVSEFIPIQLSFGFTLLGVGGLLGLNRTVELDALQVGVRDGTLNSILFPVDVVANAPRIISDLKRVFPPHEDRFLIGPMGKLGWGTPTIISLEIGLLLEIPRPAFAILGVLRVQLPAEEFGALYIQVNFVGSVDFEKGQLQFDASLYNSRILIFPLTGDMALRVYWGGDANFLLSVGGFHPAYTPPPMNIGALSRLGIVVAAGVPAVRAEAYFAVTSNSVQFGSRVEIMYGVDFFNVFGFVSLDVLIQFNPFQFIAEISAMFGVRSGSTVLFGIQVKGTLQGPTPWHVRGEASFEIGFIIKIRLSADFEVTIGEARHTMAAPIDALGEIRKSLDAANNWRAVLPRFANQHVSLRELPGAGDALVLHPFGALEISQKIAPLNIAIQKIGASRPDRGSIFRVAAQLNGVDAATVPSREQFAPGQFFEMSDAEKLSRPSFASYDAGVVLGADIAPQTDFRRGRDVQYEVIYLPEHHPVKLFFKLAIGLFTAFARGGSAAQSSLSQERQAPSPVAAAPASIAAEHYAVVSMTDMTMHAAPLVFSSATAADHAVAQLVSRQPELLGTVQVVPASMVRHAA